MKKARVKSYWNGMNPSWRIGNEVEVEDTQFDGLVEAGCIEPIKEEKPAVLLSRRFEASDDK